MFSFNYTKSTSHCNCLSRQTRKILTMNFISAVHLVTAVTQFSVNYIQLSSSQRKIMEPTTANHEFLNFDPKTDYD